MNVSEGIDRAAKILSLLSVCVVLCGLVWAFSHAFLASWPREETFFTILAVSFAIAVLMQLLVWMLDGFSGTAKSNVLWPLKKRKKTIAVHSNETRTAKEVEKNLRLKGVGGWLLLLVILLMLVSPILTFGSTSGQFYSVEMKFPEMAQSSNWQTYKSIMWTATLGYISASFFAAYRLLKTHEASSVSLVIGFLWIGKSTLIVTDFFASIALLNLDVSVIFSPQVLGNVIQWIVIASLWTLYLKRSKRVRNTYI